MRAPLRPASALLVFALVSGCAMLSPQPVPAPKIGEVASLAKARESVAVGRSTKADVEAVLGRAIVVDFASGYEVWVYRETLPLAERNAKPQAPVPNAERAELVLLFAPHGVLAKVRDRRP